MKFIIREKNLGILCNALRQLLFNIQFLNLPLAESFKNISKNENNTVGRFFYHISNEMAENKRDTYSLWRESIEFFKEELMFKMTETEILLDFSKRLGTGDKNNEISNIECTIMRLKSIEEEATTECKGNVKVFRGLGTLTGVFIVILLL